MKSIVVLIDFTEGAKSALKQSFALAKATGATLYGLHVVSSGDKLAGAEQLLSDYMNKYCDDSIHFESIVSEGTLVNAINNSLKKISPDLVVVCTHGVKGILQHLFGAQILKLVQDINYPTIVIQENFIAELVNIKKILFPIGPHPDFLIKIKQTAVIAKALNAEVVIYEIERTHIDFENILNANIELSKVHFTEMGVSFKVVIEETTTLTIGYFRQTMEYAVKNNINLISQMSTVSNNDVLFGVGDKEKFFVNSQGVSILGCNSALKS